MTYQNIQSDIVTVSGYTNNGKTIVYKRDVVGPSAINSIYWSYPTSDKTQWASAVTRTARAFKPGRTSSGQGRAVLSYNMYTNPRFGFTTLWPSSFKAKPSLVNGQGQTWVSPDGQAKLSVYGSNNFSSYLPKQEEAIDSRGLSVTYKNIQGDIVTVSGYTNNGKTIVYKRDVVGPGAINGIYWSYPTSDKAQWASAVAQTAQTFKPGDITSMH